jgi:uncharacterized protein (TIGR02996 family)
MSPQQERVALLQAIVEDPDDDLPRLAFADWLTDNGRPEWGEFIRRHCAITPCLIGDEDPFAAFHSCPREQMSLLPTCHLRPEIRRGLLEPFVRIKQQLGLSQEEDTLPFPQLIGYVGRGFVEWLGLSGGRAVRAFSDHADEVFGSTPLLWLSLDSWGGVKVGEDKVTGALLQGLLRRSGIERLRAVDLHSLRFDDELAEALLSAGGKLRLVRAYDEIRSDALRDRLKDRFGERLRLSPLPDYHHRSRQS